ncbi:GTP-binding protein [Candidatus Woesearchaeota archaeon]|nr:GTP-binding protein [Candidatus Woesearchaeota archaeon]
MKVHFDRIPSAESPRAYLDAAFGKGRKSGVKSAGIRDPQARLRAKERDRLQAVSNTLVASLQKLHDAYPSMDQFGEFNKNVFELDMDFGEVKQALGGLGHAIRTVKGVVKEHQRGINTATSRDNIIQIRKACLGRVASILNSTKKHFETLNKARNVFRSMPAIDESLFTIAIAGFPNVGKSTLLKKLTGADPEIKAYAFTTKGLNVGYFTYKYNKIQCVDTPGTLNRKKANAIEQKAELALRYLAHVIVYVFDPTEESYSMKMQGELYDTLTKLDKDILVYISKTDLTEELHNLEGYSDAEDLKKELKTMFKEWI